MELLTLVFRDVESQEGVGGKLGWGFWLPHRLSIMGCYPKVTQNDHLGWASSIFSLLSLKWRGPHRNSTAPTRSLIITHLFQC